MRGFQLKSNPTQTALTITVGFLVIFLYTGQEWACYVAAAVSGISLLSRRLSLYIEWLWFKLAMVLSFIMPNILLTVLYFLALVPIAALSRMFGKRDPLRLKPSPSSFFETVDRDFTEPGYFKKPW